MKEYYSTRAMTTCQREEEELKLILLILCLFKALKESIKYERKLERFSYMPTLSTYQQHIHLSVVANGLKVL
jgi:hypothetical protein